MFFDTVPAELKRFIEPATRPLIVRPGDLNADGRSDYLLILQKLKKSPTDPEPESGSRPLLLLIRQRDGSLKLQKRNDRVVLGRTQGGVFGDPLAEVSVGRGTLTVEHYGGSNWRWESKVTFKYEPRQKSWHLVRVEKSEYHTSEPGKVKTTVETPPRHFGTIDFADFDPETYRTVGKKKTSR